MPSGQEVLSSLYGAWRVLRMDPAALGYFNQSIDGFWRSFFAVVLVLPIAGLITFMDIRSASPEVLERLGDPDLLLLGRLIGILLAWIAYPVAMIWLSRLLQLSHRYVVYIIVWNWSNVIGAAIYLVLSLLEWIGLLSAGAATGVGIFVFGYVMFYAYLVLRAGLGCATGAAIGLAVFEQLLDFLIVIIVTSLVQSALS